MTEAILKLQLAAIAQSYRQFKLWRGLTRCWLWASVTAGVLLLLYALTDWWLPMTLPIVAACSLIAAWIVRQRSRRTAPAFRWIARQVEQENPKLRTVLLAAVEQEPDKTTGELGYLQERVILEALAQNRQQPWLQKHVERVFFAQCSQWVSLALYGVFLAILGFAAPASRSLARVSAGITVTPGDTTVERGSGLVVLARFGGRLPAEAALVVNSASETNRRIPLAKNLDDPVFGGSIPEVKSDLVYHIEYGDKRTAKFHVKVFDYPALQRADANLKFPEYTGLPDKKIEDTRRVSAVEGTALDYSFLINKPVTSAKLIAKNKSSVPLVADDARPNVYWLKTTLAEAAHYELQLIDAAGRTNKTPTDIVIDVLENRPAELKLTFPRQDIRVTPIEELSLQANASDDFGLRAFGVAYNLAGEETKYVELGQKTTPNEKRPLQHLLAMEDLEAEPDQLVSYFVWADDLGPDGQLRRTSSDMYFAEVRHFEEIFREGQQQQAGANGGQQSESEKLSELQKQIMNATWKLHRRETKPKPSEKYKKDAEVVQESQEKALGQANELKEKAENPRLKPLIDEVVKQMEKAVKHLTDAVEKNSAGPLSPALSSEQAAYQALLKLQAREFQVSRGRGGGGSGKGGGRSQQQMDQLELKQSENRYETQRQASSAQMNNPQQREQLQVLNRLKELAQRQQDLNQRLKELQTALQEAKSEEEREAVRRQLKRLREEERQILADVDEVNQRMNRPENQSQMAESREQLEQTRAEVRRAAEELDKGAVSQALAAGTRAERDLQQLRDDFRKRTSSQFTEEMRQMRSQARELAQKQEDISKKMEALAESQRKSLSDTTERNQLAEQLVQQKSGLTNLMTHIRQVTEQAEAAEPLLARQLYDTFRRTDQSKAGNALDMSSELIRRGFVNQASEVEPQARTIVNEVKRGVERAAESVLGDEIESLRMARNELDELNQQLEREIAQATRGTNQTASASSAQGSANQQGGERTSSSDSSGRASEQENSDQQAPSGRGRQNQSGETAQNASGQRNGQAQGQGQRQGQPNQSGQSAQNASSQSGARGEGQQGQGGQDGQQGSGQPSRTSPQRRSLAGGNQAAPNNAGGRNHGGRDGGGSGPGGDWDERNGGWTGPLTGNDYTNWSDRLRDVEELVDVPELRERIAQIRDRARSTRVDFKRHSKEPQWDLVKAEIAAPLAEVRQRVHEELARRASTDSLVPIDRDPVPQKFSELVRRYYEKLGAGE